MDKINNECKREYFDKLNIKTTTKPFWKTCKPYFSNKHSHGGSKITLIENDRIISENNKIAKTFNTYFESVTDFAYKLHTKVFHHSLVIKRSTN